MPARASLAGARAPSLAQSDLNSEPEATAHVATPTPRLVYSADRMELVVEAVAEVTVNFAGPHLWAAARFARQAHETEQVGLASAEPPGFHDELQANVVAAVLLAA